MIRMTKLPVFDLSDVLKPHVEQENTRYRLAIPIQIRVACVLFNPNLLGNQNVVVRYFRQAIVDLVLVVKSSNFDCEFDV